MADIPDPSEISPLEVRIISALRNDARKRTTDVAKELGVTSGTYRRCQASEDDR